MTIITLLNIAHQFHSLTFAPVFHRILDLKRGCIFMLAPFLLIPVNTRADIFRSFLPRRPIASIHSLNPAQPGKLLPRYNIKTTSLSRPALLKLITAKSAVSHPLHGYLEDLQGIIQTRHSTPALFLSAFGKYARRTMPDNETGH